MGIEAALGAGGAEEPPDPLECLLDRCLATEILQDAARRRASAGGQHAMICSLVTTSPKN
jgi:hypothetical protein